MPPFLAGNLLKESNIQILKSYEIKKQMLEKETKSEKTKGRGKTPSISKGKSTATVHVRNKDHLLQNKKHLALYPSILAVQMAILLIMRRYVAFATNSNQKNFPIWQKSDL